MIPDWKSQSIDENARRRFEAAWRAGNLESLETYLPAETDPRHLATLAELVLIDLEFWWKRYGKPDPNATEVQKPALVESYLQRFPRLNEPAVVVNLLRQEFLARHQYGDCPGIDEFRRRFPELVVTGQEIESPDLSDQSQTKTKPSQVRLREPEQETPPIGRLPSSSPGLHWPQFPERYQLLGEIARGGMGAILRGRDVELGRDIAIKVMLETHRAEPEMLQRFVEEAQISGQLQHPGIVPVYELGQWGPHQPYFTMKLVKGRTLANLLKERTPKEVPRFLSIFEQVCQTLAYAHARGVIHRDLKPANIMVGSFGEVQVMDWGLAKVLPKDGSAGTSGGEGNSPEESTIIHTKRRQNAAGAGATDSATEAGSVLGTPAYMAPEQARGDIERLDERGDVFGLGAILCEILTGQPPYTDQGSEDILLRAVRAELGEAWGRLDQCGADPILIALAKRCLEPLKDQRPRHAGEVAQGITGYLESVQQKLRQAEVERASAETRAGEEKKRRLLERQKRRTILALAAVVLLLIGGTSLVGVWYQNVQARREADNHFRQTEVTAALATGEKIRQELHQELADPRKVPALLSNLAKWEKMLEGVRIAQERAVALAGTEPLPAELASQLEELSQQLGADQKNYQWAKELDTIRLEAATPVNGRYKPATAGPKYAQSFTQQSLDLVAGDPAVLAAKISQLPLRFVLVAALDHWADVIKDQGLQSRLLEVARVADPDLWRNQVRSQKNWQDKAKLKALAEIADLAGQSPQMVLLLAWRLHALEEPAVPFLREALVHHPGDFWLHYEMGRMTKNVVERVGCYQAAAALRPNSSLVHNSLGSALEMQGNFPAAVIWFKKALQLAPHSAPAWNNVGHILSLLDDRPGAISHFHKAIALDDTFALAHTNLGYLLKEQGEFVEGYKYLKKGHELSTKQPDWPYQSAGWANHCLELIEAEKKLPMFLPGQVKSKDYTELSRLTLVCHFKKMPVAAVYFCQEAFDLNFEKALRELPYFGACAAALAAAGKGKDVEHLQEKDKTKLRQRALSWLFLILNNIPKTAKTNSKIGLMVQRQLLDWQTDPQLASVREPQALASLPEEERKAWQEFWADVGKIIKDLQ